MITVLIECGEDAAALGASLATLVPGAVEGVIRDVVVLDVELDAATRKVADHAGCRIEPGDAVAQVVAGAKGDWILLLEPGARLSADWIERVLEHVGDGGTGRTPRPARFSPARESRLQLPAVFRRGRRPLRDGLLLPKAQAIVLAGGRRSLGDLAKGVASRRLEATIRPRSAKGRA